MGSGVSVQDSSFAVLAAIWLLVTLPLAWLVAWELEVTTHALRLAGASDALPILTRGYLFLGTSGIYLVALLPGLLGLALRPSRASRVAVIALTVALVASLYFVFLGLLAAMLAYVKVLL